jgi:two-component sensor histidine kinase
MSILDRLLNKNHFPLNDRKRLKSTLISLTALLAIFILCIDSFHSFKEGFYTMGIIEVVVIVIFLSAYLLFPIYITLYQMIYSILSSFATLLILSLVIHGENPYFALFWLATFPVYTFFFLGLQKGRIVSAIIVLAILITSLLSYLEYTNLYKFDFLIQLAIGYGAISYLLYVLEVERSSYEVALNQAIKQKEILLKEVHHRAKNNMQIIMALLETQSFKIDNPKYQKLFETHIQRLKAMALIHEHLYKGSDYDKLALDTYLKEITKSFQSITRHKIVTTMEHFMIDTKIAMNLGLIYNELLSNAIEYAYDKNESGLIEVSLRRLESECILEIKDNGKGFDTAKEYNTLGLNLIKDISSHLHPSKKLSIDTSSGTDITIYCQMKGLV